MISDQRMIHATVGRFFCGFYRAVKTSSKPYFRSFMTIEYGLLSKYESEHTQSEFAGC